MNATRVLLHVGIEAHASLVQQEISRMAQQKRDEIHVKVGWMRRSDGQRRRHEKAKVQK